MAITHPSKILSIAQYVGLTNRRNLYWSCREEKNFGDWLSPYIYETLSGNIAIYSLTKNVYSGSVYFTVGSIMHWIKDPNVAIVWGSGIIRKNSDFKKPKAIHAVRGPLTRARCQELGYECPEVYGDPALLMPLIYKVEKNVTHKIGVVPHFVDYVCFKNIIGKMEGVKVIDVKQSPEMVISEICSCEFICSSSLHGIIIAHAYKIPATRIFSDRLGGDGVKFEDYALSFSESTKLRSITMVDKIDSKNFFDLVRESAVIPDVNQQQLNLLKSCPFVKREIKNLLIEQIGSY